MNRAIIELQRDLLLYQLMEFENQLNENGIKKGKGKLIKNKLDFMEVLSITILCRF